MHIYRIHPDVERFKQLSDTEPEDMPDSRIMELVFDGKIKADNWNPPNLEWIVGTDLEGPDRHTYDKHHKIPDITHCYPGCFVLSPKAASILMPVFEEEAEFLPVPVENENWVIMNVTNMQDALDKANSRYKIRSDGTVGRILEMVLDKSKITNARLFRLIDKPAILFTDGSPGSFKEIVESNKLTGLTFDEC